MSDAHAAALAVFGIQPTGAISWAAPSAVLHDEALRRGEGMSALGGALVVRTGQYTGRSPNDKFIVDEPESRDQIAWGAVNQPFPVERFARLRARMLAYLQGRDVFVQNLLAGADPAHQLRLRVISDQAWYALFARNMFIVDREREQRADVAPDWTLLHLPAFRASPDIDGVNSEVFVIISFAQRQVLIGGTGYAGEMKKSIFTVMNYLLPGEDVLSMHCSCNADLQQDNISLFFGLSGTGKTTLSIDSRRRLVGDDEHGWGPNGVFNIEGGCYAKVIRVTPESEPEIYQATRRFGTVLENVVIDPQTRQLDLHDARLTENTRAAFPISLLDIADDTGCARHPDTIFFLTADAFGVLPPIARLTPEQASYYFLLGYTAKVAGTERGVREPQATFSACFGAPFMVRPPTVYAAMLADKIRNHHARVWLINTGWTGGPYGEGERMPLVYTRAMVHAVQQGRMRDVAAEPDKVFGLAIPQQVPDVPDRILQPQNTWRNPTEYEAKARDLAGRFRKAFEPFEASAAQAVRDAGPQL